MIGPSGSGKTTALRAVAGFVRPARGRIRIGGSDVTDLPPYARGIGMVVQNYALFPHMRVADNVAFGLHARGAPKALVDARVAEALRVVGMAQYARRLPARAFAAASSSASRSPARWRCARRCCCSTSRCRRSTRRSAARWSRSSPGCTPSCRDLTDALRHPRPERGADARRPHRHPARTARLSAVGRTGDLYRRPPNRFAAEFLGRANLLPVVVDRGRSRSGFVARAGGRGAAGRARRPASAPARARLLCVRPQNADA